MHPGEIATVRVDAAVDPGWHVYSTAPNPYGKGPIPSEIVSVGDWKAEQPTSEDPPIRKMDPNFEMEVGTHESKATFERQFRVPTGATAASGAPISVTLHYQTCNDKICLPPTDAVIPVTAAIAAGPVRAEYANAKPVEQPRPKSPSGSPSGGSGLIAFLLAALGAGLLAILTPCVFPLIPITLTSFVKQAEGNKRRLARIAVTYSAGIIALYVAVGAIVSVTLGAAGVQNIAANPWVNLAEFVVFVVFALSFFETITLRLPGNLSGLQKAARDHGGTAGLMLMGTTFVVASFTCTAPFVGTLLVSSAGGERVMPLLGMFVFAVAFVSPFLLAAAFPRWIGKIPKSGVWLARVKATLGFIELAAALKFLSNADLGWHWHLLTQPVLLALWADILFLTFLYLIGALRFGVVAETETDAQRRVIGWPRRAWAGLFLVSALYCFYGLTGRPISPYLGAFLPPEGYGGYGAAAGKDVPWPSDYDTALAQAKASGKRLLIDFTGYTCTNCRLNEKNVFPNPGVQEGLKLYERVQLYTDGGKDGKKNQALQERLFGDVALPLYGIIDPGTEQVVDKVEGVTNVAAFSDFLAKNHRHPVPATPTAPIAPSAMWQPLTKDAVAAATAAGKPVIIDFTAAWCVNCKEIERNVFENPKVKPLLEQNSVTLRADLTDWNSPASTALQGQYGFGQLPTVILLDKSGKEVRAARIDGLLSVDAFMKRVKQVTGG